MSRDSDCGTLTGPQEAVFRRIHRIVGHSLAVNAAQWMHFRGCPEQQSRVLAWIAAESPVNSLLFFVLPNLTLQAAAFLPAKRQLAKVTYMLKLGGDRVVSGENFGDIVIIGDLSANLITFTAQTMRSVFAPLLTNPLWLRQWPPETGFDLAARLQLVMGAVRAIGDGDQSSSAADDDGCWQTLRQIRQQQYDAANNHQLLIGAVTELCISLERRVRRTTPKPATSVGFSDLCATWQAHWNHLLVLNDKLDELNPHALGDLLSTAEAPEYRQSLMAAVQMLRSESADTAAIVANLRALANQLHCIQNASGQEIHEAAAPMVRCCARMFRAEFGSAFARGTWRSAVCRSICAEFGSEIRRQLAIGGGVAPEVRVQDVCGFRLAEQTVQLLRFCIRAEMALQVAEAKAIIDDLLRFAARLAAIRRLIETALDWRNVEQMAVVAGGVAVFSNTLLLLAERFGAVWKQLWMRSAGDVWTTDGEFEIRVGEFELQADGLRDAAVKAFPRVMESCGTVEHCRRMSDFIGSLYSLELKTDFYSEWSARQERLVAIERTEVDTLLEGLPDLIDIDGRLSYPSVANNLLAIRALRLRLQSQDRHQEMTSLQLKEDDVLQQFLVRFQKLERTAGGNVLLNMLVISRLNLCGGSELRTDLRRHLV